MPSFDPRQDILSMEMMMRCCSTPPPGSDRVSCNEDGPTRHQCPSCAACKIRRRAQHLRYDDFDRWQTESHQFFAFIGVRCDSIFLCLSQPVAALPLTLRTSCLGQVCVGRGRKFSSLRRLAHCTRRDAGTLAFFQLHCPIVCLYCTLNIHNQ